MHWHDIRVIEVGDRAGFGQVGFGVFGTGHQLAVRNFNGDEPLQLLVISQIDEAEATLSEYPFNPIATNDFRRLR